MQTFSGHNSDSYTSQGKIWQIAKRFNQESREHIFDRHGNKLTTNCKNEHGLKDVAPKYPREEMHSRQCLKHETLNVSRRKVSKSEYKPVGVL